MGLSPLTQDDIATELASQGLPDSQIAEEALRLIALYDTAFNETPGQQFLRSGAKPKDTGKDEDTILFDIPHTQYAVRVFPGETGPSTGMWYLDYYDSTRHEPVNTPQGFSIHIVGPPQLSVPPGAIISVERACGVLQKDIRPGQEKFGLLERAWCKLERPGQVPFFFKMPTRNEPEFAQSRPFRFVGLPPQPTPVRFGPLGPVADGPVAPCSPSDIGVDLRDDDDDEEDEDEDERDFVE
ncbi:hypothetical protein B0H12DRAFT_654593 [Mycena haematopus]|nr:hypothetical protein B0H12DRAFT_654593 [Mycena haematopus]